MTKPTDPAYPDEENAGQPILLDVAKVLLAGFMAGNTYVFGESEVRAIKSAKELIRLVNENER